MSHPTPHDTHPHIHIYTDTHIKTHHFSLFCFFFPLSLRLSGHCWCHRWNYEFNIQVRDAYLGRSKPSGDVEERKKKWNKSLVGWQIDTASERPWNLKEKVIKNERKILNSISPRFALRMLAFCSAFSFSGAIRPFLCKKKKENKGRQKAKMRETRRALLKGEMDGETKQRE